MLIKGPPLKAMIKSRMINDKPKMWLLFSYKVTLEEDPRTCQAETSGQVDLSAVSVYSARGPTAPGNGRIVPGQA
jgi:hypothetical protein